MLCVGAVGAVPLPICRQEHVFFLGGSSSPSSSGQRLAHGGFLGRGNQPPVA